MAAKHTSCCWPHPIQPRGHGCPPLWTDRAGPRPRSPWRGRFPPDSPPAVPRPGSHRSSVLPPAPTPRRRTRGACGVCLFPPACLSRQAPPRSPGSRAESFLTCPEVPNVHEFSRPRRVRPPLAMTRRSILPSPSGHKAGTRNEVFRGSLAGPPVPLSTLHRQCHHCRRMTRGQRGSLLLRRRALSSPTPRRFIPALSDSHSCSPPESINHGPSPIAAKMSWLYPGPRNPPLESTAGILGTEPQIPRPPCHEIPLPPNQQHTPKTTQNT